MAFIVNNILVEGNLSGSTFFSGGTDLGTVITNSNIFPTGFTYTNNTLTIRRNQGQPDLTAIFDTITGLTVNGNLIVTGTTTSTTFVKSGGTSAQFLMANGSTISTGQTPGALIASLTSSANVNQNLTTTASTIIFDTDEMVAYGTISRSANTFTVSADGIYQFSLQPQILENNNTNDTTIWVQKNGINVPRSAARVSSATAGDLQVLPLIVSIELITNDQIIFKGITSAANGSTLQFTASGATVPAIPAVIIDIKGWKK